MRLSTGGSRVRASADLSILGTRGADSPHRSNAGSEGFVRLEETLYRFLEQEQERKLELKLKTTDFKLAGLGEAGEDCGKIVMTDIDIGKNEDDIRAVKFKPLRCSRIECPECYYEWAIRQSFEVALKIEAMAEIRGERPFHVVFSIHPLECYGLTWTDINQRLWRRGRRRLKYIRCKVARDYEAHKIEDCPKCSGAKTRCEVHKRGKEHSVEDCPICHDLSQEQYGAEGIFHPFRIKKKWKELLGGSGDEEWDGNAKLWKKIRERLLIGLGKLEDYVKIGYHAHNILFTDFPERQKNEEYVIKFTRNFERLDRQEVIALVRYLITHTATIEETTVYRNHVCNYCGHSYRANQYRCGHCGRKEIEETHVKRNRVVHPIRSYGILHNFNPKEALIEHFGREEGLRIYHELAHEIANSLFLRNEGGELVTMEWNEELEELEYPAYAEEFVTIDEEANWISVWKLFDLVYETDFLDHLTREKREFMEDLLDYLRKEGKPPPIEDCGKSLTDVMIIPESVGVVAPIVKLDKAEFRKCEKLNRTYSLRKRILELIQNGENDIFKLDICLADYDLGEILRTVDLLSEDGTVIREPDGELVLGV